MCEYCEVEPLNIIPYDIKNMALARVVCDELVIFQNMKARSAKINYCPMCGKKLVMEVRDAD